ncbi:MAG: nucleotidyltransferase domain-containing protein [Anaerolineae bacterium]|nr:nucleotidyltransferase domain-containing protein [Anaerolineae bacterium]
MDISIEPLLQRLVQKLVADNTLAIGLTGSHARGDANAHSDIDLWHFVKALPDDPRAAYTLRMDEGWLVSVSVRRLADEAALMHAPRTAIAVVPGFRQMRVLHDPLGELARVIEEARNFPWDSLREAAADQASYELCGNAEEVGKLLAALEQDDDQMALFWLHAMIFGLLRAASLGLGIAVETENRQIEQLQTAVGVDSAWSRALREALGLPPADAAQRVRAGLRLYRATAALLETKLRPDDQMVVDATLQRIEGALS